MFSRIKLTSWITTSGWILFVYILLFGTVQPLLGQSETQVDAKQQRVRRKKLGGKKAWEKIVSFPGTLIFLPLDLTLKLGEASIGLVDQSRVIPKTHDLLTSDDGRRALRPTYASRTGGGIRVYQKGWISPESRLTLLLTAGPKERQRYQLQMKRLSLFGGPLSTDLWVRYQFLSDESFFGIGPDSQHDDESNFAHEQGSAEASLGTKFFGERISLDTIIGFDLNDIEEGKDKSIDSTTDLFNRKTLPGLEEQVSIGRLQIGLTYDSRNRPGVPSRGSEASLAVGVFEALDNDDFGFWKFKVDLRQYIHLFYNRVIALRVAGEVTQPFSGREVPFYYLSELGRTESIRGLTRGRFRDQDMVLASLEYRYPIWRTLNAMFFVDVGQVAENIFDDLSKDDLEVSYGGGIQIWGTEGLTTAIMIGKSSDEFRIHFGLNQ